jgi:hypothetical protein
MTEDRFFTGSEDPIEHNAAIGRFISAFSGVEICLHLLFKSLVGLPDDLARVLLEKDDIPSLLMKIPEIAKAKGNADDFMAKYQPLREVIEALWAIRNRLAHQPFMRTATEFRFTDAFWKPAAKAKSYICTVEQLNCAASFLDHIKVALTWLIPGNGPDRLDNLEGLEGFFDPTHRALRERQNLPPKVSPGNPDDWIESPLLRSPSYQATQNPSEGNS